MPVAPDLAKTVKVRSDQSKILSIITVLNFPMRFVSFTSTLSKMKYFKKSALLALWGIVFHRFGKAVNAEP